MYLSMFVSVVIFFFLVSGVGIFVVVVVDVCEVCVDCVMNV